jgi:hypothetical protein
VWHVQCVGRVSTLAGGGLLKPQTESTRLEGQYKKQLVDDATVLTQLKSLNIDQGEATALIARWTALKTRPPLQG